MFLYQGTTQGLMSTGRDAGQGDVPHDSDTENLTLGMGTCCWAPDVWHVSTRQRLGRHAAAATRTAVVRQSQSRVRLRKDSDGREGVRG